MVKSKIRQIASYESDLAKKQKESADIGSKIFEKEKKQFDAYLKLRRRVKMDEPKMQTANNDDEDFKNPVI